MKLIAIVLLFLFAAACSPAYVWVEGAKRCRETASGKFVEDSKCKK